MFLELSKTFANSLRALSAKSSTSLCEYLFSRSFDTNLSIALSLFSKNFCFVTLSLSFKWNFKDALSSFSVGSWTSIIFLNLLNEALSKLPDSGYTFVVPTILRFFRFAMSSKPFKNAVLFSAKCRLFEPHFSLGTSKASISLNPTKNFLSGCFSACFFSCLNTFWISTEVWPIYGDETSANWTSAYSAPNSLASIFAEKVLPVPDGPYIKMHCSGRFTPAIFAAFSESPADFFIVLINSLTLGFTQSSSSFGNFVFFAMFFHSSLFALMAPLPLPFFKLYICTPSIPKNAVAIPICANTPALFQFSFLFSFLAAFCCSITCIMNTSSIGESSGIGGV